MSEGQKFLKAQMEEMLKTYQPEIFKRGNYRIYEELVESELKNENVENKVGGNFEKNMSFFRAFSEVFYAKKISKFPPTLFSTFWKMNF